MLADTLLLLKLYWTIDRRADSGTRRSSRALLVIGGIVLVLLSGVLGYFASTLTEETGLIQLRAEILPGLMFTVVLFGVVFVGFNQALQALYLSDDLDRLLVAPVHSQAVMTAKLLSRLPSMVTFMLAATIPALITFGIGVGLNPLYYMLGLLFILVTPLFGISLGALVAIFLVRLLPARQLNEWVGAASIVIGVLLSLLVYLPTFLRNGGETTSLDAQSLASLENFINHLGDIPLPSTWVGSALVEIGRGQIAASAIGAIFTYLLITVGFFLVTVLLANRLFLTGWLRMKSGGAVVQEIGERPGMFGRSSLAFILAYKDWLLRIRDPRLLATLFTAFILAFIALFAMLRPDNNGTSLLSPSDTVEGGSVDPISAGIVFCGMLYFLGWMLFNRLALTSLSIERQAFYILKVAPISPGQLLRSKTFGIFVPYAAISTIGLIVGLFLVNFSLLWAPYGWLVLMIMGYGLLSFLVSVGFLYPNLVWDDPRRMTNSKASLPSLIGSAVYSLVAVAVAWFTYIVANAQQAYAVPIVIAGLALLAGGTWLFVHRRSRKVESAWVRIGVE
jgi:hypothetical protein